MPFNELKFEPFNDGIIARFTFPNQRGVNVIQTPNSYGGREGFYELAVLDADGRFDYSTPVTDNVEGWLAPEEVTELMATVAALPA